MFIETMKYSGLVGTLFKCSTTWPKGCEFAPKPQLVNRLFTVPNFLLIYAKRLRDY